MVQDTIQSTVANAYVALQVAIPFLAERSYAESSIRNLTGVGA